MSKINQKIIAVINTKGGCGKSTTALNIVASSSAKNFVMIDVDELNKSQQNYAQEFADYKVINDNEIPNLGIEMGMIKAQNKNAILDVGVSQSVKVLEEIISSRLTDLINFFVVPLKASREDCQNALKTAKLILEVDQEAKIVFAFSNYEPHLQLELQYEVFFRNLAMICKNTLSEDDYVLVKHSNLFVNATNRKKSIHALASDKSDYRKDALTAMQDSKTVEFKDLMQKDLLQRSIQIFFKESVLPQHKKLMQMLGN